MTDGCAGESVRRIAPGPLAPPALEAHGLTYVRGRQAVLRSVELEIAEGEMVGLTGPNGAGKTTLLLCLAGVLRPAAGQVLWSGRSARSPATRRLIGFLGHESGLYLTLTARENLLFAGRMHGLHKVVDRADELLSETGLRHLAGQRVARLSRGMRQRLAIARAAMHDPPVLLLDEPFTSLDTDGRHWLVDFLGRLRERRRSILLVTHADELKGCILDRLLWLRAGRVATAPCHFDGRPAPESACGKGA